MPKAPRSVTLTHPIRDPGAPKPATLTERLAELHRQARQYDSRPVRMELARGLRVTLKYSMQGELWLQLSRQDGFPSVTEWSTVIKHFPGGAEQLDETLQAGEDKGIYWMRARIQVTPKMI